ncbi:MAG: hypothetical protein U9N85_11640, partial [Bacteroidota bacterium]|nr:hypothetical protein [Bacteroidota bacterium]
EKQAAVYRTFKVNTTGLCNWDRIMKQSQPLFAKSNFTFDKTTDEAFADIDVYYFVRNNETFSRFNLATTDSIQIAQDSTAQFVAVLSDNEAAVFNAEAYSKIDFDKLRTEKEYTFNMSSVTINSKDDIVDLLK